MYHLIDYVWCVEKFCQYFEPHEQEVYPLLTSPTFAYKNTRWVLNLYPEGLGDSASQGYISLFIKYMSEDPETINAKVELSLLNNKNERMYCRDTGDHQYQTFIDFGYKQFLKMHDIKEQKDELITNGFLKIFARVEFATLPSSSLTWTNYDLLLFKENFKELYESKNLSDILVKVIRKSNVAQSSFGSNQPPQTPTTATYNTAASFSTPFRYSTTSSPHSTNHFHPYISAKMRKKSNSASTSSQVEPNLKTQSNNNITAHVGSLMTNSNMCGSTEAYAMSECYADPRTANLICCSLNQWSANQIESLDIKAHKFILASRSGKFRELLRTNLIKLNSPEISLDFCPALNSANPGKENCDGCSKKSELDSMSSFVASSSSPSSSSFGVDCNLLDSPMPSASLCSSASASSSSSSSSAAESFPPSHSPQCMQCLLSFKETKQYCVQVASSEDISGISDLLIIETDRNPKVIEYLVRYMYTGYLDSFDSFAKDIYEISKEYKVHGLTNLARDNISKELNIQNCCDYLVFCVINNDYELNNKIQTFITDNFETVIKTNAYKQAKRKYRELFENTFNEIFKKIPAFNKVHF